MNTQYFLGIELFTYKNWSNIDNEIFQFCNVKFPFKSMKQFNRNTVTFELEGTLVIYDKNGKVLWEGFPTQIEEFKEMLLERM